MQHKEKCRKTSEQSFGLNQLFGLPHQKAVHCTMTLSLPPLEFADPIKIIIEQFFNLKNEMFLEAAAAIVTRPSHATQDVQG